MFRGLPILLVYIGIISLSIYGLIGHQLPCITKTGGGRFHGKTPRRSNGIKNQLELPSTQSEGNPAGDGIGGRPVGGSSRVGLALYTPVYNFIMGLTLEPSQQPTQSQSAPETPEPLPQESQPEEGSSSQPEENHPQ